MKEKELQRAIMEYARTHGWLVGHFGSSVKWVRRGDTYGVIPDPDAKGIPDLFLLRGERLLVRELKGEKGRIRPEQAIWIAAFRTAGIDADYWYPKDWEDGVIQGVLA